MSPKHQNDKQHAPIFLDTAAIWLSRLRADNEDSFMQLFSEETMEAHYKMKHIGNIKMRFLEDHIEFKSNGLFSGKPPRQTLGYDQIERFVTTQSYPTVLNLGVKDNEASGMYCEMLKFKNETSLNQACDLIQKARQHPNFRLVTNDNLQVLSTLSKISQSSLLMDLEQTNNKTSKGVEEMMENDRYLHESQWINGTVPNAVKVPTPTLVKETHPAIVVKKHNHHHPSRSSSGVSMGHVPVTEEVSYRARTPQPIRIWHPEDIETLRKDLTRTVQDGSAWSVDVKTIETHPLYGNRISENGSIYMFIAHMMPEQTRAYTACSSSSGSLDSLPDHQDFKSIKQH